MAICLLVTAVSASCATDGASDGDGTGVKFASGYVSPATLTPSPGGKTREESGRGLPLLSLTPSSSRIKERSIPFWTGAAFGDGPKSLATFAAVLSTSMVLFCGTGLGDIPPFPFPRLGGAMGLLAGRATSCTLMGGAALVAVGTPLGRGLVWAWASKAGEASGLCT